MSSVELQVLHWVAQSKLVDSGAADHTLGSFDDGQVVDEFLSIGQVSEFRDLVRAAVMEVEVELTWCWVGSQSFSSNLYLVTIAMERTGAILIMARCLHDVCIALFIIFNLINNK